MSWFSRMKVSTRLIGSFMILILITLMIGVTSVITISNQNRDYSEVFG